MTEGPAPAADGDCAVYLPALRELARIMSGRKSSVSFVIAVHPDMLNWVVSEGLAEALGEGAAHLDDVALVVNPDIGLDVALVAHGSHRLAVKAYDLHPDGFNPAQQSVYLHLRRRGADARQALASTRDITQ